MVGCRENESKLMRTRELLEVMVGQFFVVFISSPTPQIYIFDENKIEKCYLSN